ncbi:hypothetical protein FOZ62_023621, partial [Perkinsus olseni]
MAFCFRFFYAALMALVVYQVGGAESGQHAWDDYCARAARVTGSKCNLAVGFCEGSSVPCGGADVPPSSTTVGPALLSLTTGAAASTSGGTTASSPFTGPSSTAVPSSS